MFLLVFRAEAEEAEIAVIEEEKEETKTTVMFHEGVTREEMEEMGLVHPDDIEKIKNLPWDVQETPTLEDLRRIKQVEKARLQQDTSKTMGDYEKVVKTHKQAQQAMAIRQTVLSKEASSGHLSDASPDAEALRRIRATLKSLSGNLGSIPEPPRMNKTIQIPDLELAGEES